jgi:hypothetical protein
MDEHIEDVGRGEGESSSPPLPLPPSLDFSGC